MNILDKLRKIQSYSEEISDELESIQMAEIDKGKTIRFAVSVRCVDGPARYLGWERTHNIMWGIDRLEARSKIIAAAANGFDEFTVGRDDLD
jgi:hypothetical protein